MLKRNAALSGFVAAAITGGLAPAAMAQQSTQSASARAMLEEVVVTARRTEESLADLPLSVAAITADQMQAQGIYNVQQLHNFVPNISLTEDVRANDTALFIRGLGGGFSNPSQVYGTGMYVDGHIQVGNLGAFNSTADIERIEVLRGPQGTLFGKNTTGGAISIITAKPGPEFDSYLTLRAGEFGQTDLRGMVNVPLNDKVFMRLNAASEKNDGFWYNRYLDKDTNGSDQQTVGLTFRFLPNDHWTIDTRIGMSRDRDQDRGARCIAYPNEEVLTELAGAGFDVSGLPGPYEDGHGFWGSGPTGLGNIEYLYPGASVDYMRSCEISREMGTFVTAQDFDTKSWVDNEMFSVDATYDSAGEMMGFDNVNVQFKYAARTNSYRYLQDRDWTELKINGVGMSPISARGQYRTTDEFEVIFSGDINDRMRITSGIYMLDDKHQTGRGACLDSWLAAYDPVADTINGQFDDDINCALEGQDIFERLPDTDYTGINANNDRVTAESFGLYTQFNWSLNDQWDLDFGARYSTETRGLQNVEVQVVEGSCTHNNPGDPPPTEMCAPQIQLNRERVLNNGVFNNASADYDSITPMVSLTRHLSGGNRLEDGMVYFLISTGWLTGAFNDELNTNLVPELEPLKAFGDEHVTNYEVGFKGTFAGGNIRIAGDVFFMQYKDKQEEISLPNPDSVFGPDQTIELTQNASDVLISGIEFEMRASLWDGGFVSLDVGLLDQKYDSFMAFDPDTFEIVDFTDTATITSRTPDWTISAQVEHQFSLANGATITPQLGVYMADDYQWQEGLLRGEASRNCLQDSYAKWRTRITYEPSAGNWQASLYGNNITDERIINLCGPGNTGVYRWLLEPPAWWGAEFTMRFGG